MHVNFTLTIPMSTLLMPGTTRYYCHPVAWRSCDAVSRHIYPKRSGRPVGRPVRTVYHQASRSGRVTCVCGNWPALPSLVTRSSSRSFPPLRCHCPSSPPCLSQTGKRRPPLLPYQGCSFFITPAIRRSRAIDANHRMSDPVRNR